MSMHFRDIAAQAAADGVIGADEILSLRAAGWADGKMEPEEAEALFLANERLERPTPEWSAFFVEALSTFVVNTVEPRGYVDDAMGEELVARIDRDGQVDSLAELELLVKVLEISLGTPAALKAFALKQLEEAVLTGEGPTRDGQLDAKGINAVEADLLRRAIFAAGGDRPAAVSKGEAEMLFRLKDATLFEVNAPEWEKLFVQGVANYLFGFGGAEPLSPERALELEQFMGRECSGVGGFLARMGSSKPDFDGAFASLLDMGQTGPSAEQAAAEAGELTGPEGDWLHDMLDADEELDPLEKALIAYIAEETGEEFS
jgi:hypothetical protein